MAKFIATNRQDLNAAQRALKVKVGEAWAAWYCAAEGTAKAKALREYYAAIMAANEVREAIVRANRRSVFA